MLMDRLWSQYRQRLKRSWSCIGLSEHGVYTLELPAKRKWIVVRRPMKIAILGHGELGTYCMQDFRTAHIWDIHGYPLMILGYKPLAGIHIQNSSLSTVVGRERFRATI